MTQEFVQSIPIIIYSYAVMLARSASCEKPLAHMCRDSRRDSEWTYRRYRYARSWARLEPIFAGEVLPAARDRVACPDPHPADIVTAGKKCW